MRLLQVSLLVLGLFGVAAATTWGPPTPVTCPVDDTPFMVRPAKSGLWPPMDPHLRHVRPAAVHRCPRCGFVGTFDDLVAPRPSAWTRAAMAAWLEQAPSGTAPWQQLVRAAELAALRGDGRDVLGWRWLQAAALAPAAKAPLLRARARAHFAADSSPVSQYAAAELSRQLGDTTRARAGFAGLLADPALPPRLQRWAERGLRGVRPRGRREDPHL